MPFAVKICQCHINDRGVLVCNHLSLSDVGETTPWSSRLNGYSFDYARRILYSLGIIQQTTLQAKILPVFGRVISRT